MKTINLELSKRLASYLEDMETEYYLEYTQWAYLPQNDATFEEWTDIKTLTLEEIIAFLQNNMIRYDIDVRYTPRINKIIYKEENKENLTTIETNIMWETLLEAIEKMLEYLLDNNLLKWQS